jgi:uncharacterized Fe-S cluster protein YjdI
VFLSLMKEYSNEDITVTWDQDKCIHAKECVKNLPQVFTPEKMPWVNIKEASSEDIMSAIDRCPSGALTYKRIGSAADAQKPFSEIKAMKNGPLLVEGSCTLKDAKGKVAASRGPFALCRCGGTKNKPFCDGTHIKIEFDDEL